VQHASDNDKKEMARILSRTLLGDDGDDAILDEESLQQLAKSDIDQDDLLKELSQDELERFEKKIVAGDLTDLVELWQPWWMDRRCLIAEVGTSEHDNGASSSVPELLVGVPSFTSLTKKSPPPSIVVHLVEMLYAYTLTMRFVNGDWRDSAEAPNLLTQLSPVLVGKGAAMSGLEFSVDAILSAAMQVAAQITRSRHTAVLTVGDVILILNMAPQAVLLALSDMHHIVSTSSSHRLALKKIEFFFSWVASGGLPDLTFLLAELNAFFSEMKSSLEVRRIDKQGVLL